MTKPFPIRCSRPSEEGYVLVAVIFLLALFTIALAVALPRISSEIQRDRELETMQRGKQYARGVRMYYKKFNAYPPNVDALVKPTNNIRFLRKKYTDPTTGKEDWKPVRYGQNKAPTVMGFFGQAIGRSSIAGVGPGANGGLPGASGSPGGSSLPGGSSVPGTSTFGQQTTTTDPNALQAQSTDTSNPAGGTTTAGGSTAGSTTGSGTGLSGQTFGGGGIIGFSPNSPKKSIMVYKKKDHYNEWEFVYDPIAEQMIQGSNIVNKGGLNNSSSSGSGSGFNNGPGSGSSFNNGPGTENTSGGTSSGGSSTTPTTTPPQ